MSEEEGTGSAVAGLTVRVVKFTINGEDREVQVEPQWTLAYVLRDKLRLTGTKVVCDEGSCGACTVLVNGQPILSCMTLASTVEGKNIVTIEGLADGEALHPIQEAFLEEHGSQCGYCTPGFILTTKALLDSNPHPTINEIKMALSGNICRCGGYEHIINSVLSAAEKISGR
jgi:aerobic carbon-monoxide dehydrogenase small subunit